VLARPRERLRTKIGSKNNLYPHRHFTEQLVGTFGKSPRESDLNQKSSSLLTRRLKNYINISLQQFTHNIITQNESNHCQKSSSHTEPNTVRLTTLGHERGDCSRDQEPSRQRRKQTDKSLSKHATEGSSGLQNGSGQGLPTVRPAHEVELIEDLSGGERVGPADWRHRREAPRPTVPSDTHSAPR
jgi:hypothetical protein